MELIELHILQSFPVSCLNRDDVGAPKTAIFGGTPRARVSSQCWKRAIRLLAQSQGGSGAGQLAGKRSRHWVDKLAERLEERGDHNAGENASLAMGYLASSEDATQGAMVYISPLQLDSLAGALVEGKVGFKKKGKKITCEKGKGELKKVLDGVSDIADIAVFGRMVANDHSLTLEGAGLFSHAISTHRVSNEIDFFTAVDDVETEGAGHMGALEFNSACYYRYTGINLGLLADEDHLGHLSQSERKSAVQTLLRSTVEAVPGARRNSMFANTLPQYILGLHRSSGQPLSMANAFEKPVRLAEGLVESSSKALEDHYSQLKATYGLGGNEYRLPDVTLADLIEGLCDHVV